MTATEKLSKAERWRLKKAGPGGYYDSDQTAGWNGAFLVPLEGEMWQVIISDGGGWRHLSATNAQRRQLPSWHIMCRLRDAFFPDDSWVVQFHPPKTAYINDHAYVLHLWECLDGFPTPLECMV
jgi:hypothetical protein